MPVRRALRDCLHNFPKLDVARRNLRRHRRSLYFAVGVLAEDKPRAQTAGTKDARGGDGNAVSASRRK